MDHSPLVRPKVKVTLDSPPSSIQFCPAHPSFFVVGTYNLETNDDSETTKQARTGSLVVFSIFRESLKSVQTIIQPSAVLDIRFHPDREHQDILAVVSSTATLSVFKLDPHCASGVPLQHVSTSRCHDIGPDILFLQCNWHPRVPNAVCVTTSRGHARILTLNHGWSIESHADLAIENTLEAWSIALSPASVSSDGHRSECSTVYCGGDDSMFRYTSLPSASLDASLRNLPDLRFTTGLVKGHHDAGVTAILPTSIMVNGKGRVVVTGSYDEYLRVFVIQDLHQSHGLKRVELLTDLHLQGGVWRLDIVQTRNDHPSVRLHILASCMHAGARLVVVSTTDGVEWASEILARVEDHKSMNYGTHSMPREAEEGPLRCISTSFYDRLLCLWDYELKE